jgi:hypothetical protein
MHSEIPCPVATPTAPGSEPRGRVGLDRRRLALFGLFASACLLAACGGDDAPAAPPPRSCARARARRGTCLCTAYDCHLRLRHRHLCNFRDVAAECVKSRGRSKR